MEFSKTECKRILRTLELKAYRSVVDALRAQGALTASKHEALKNLAVTLKVGEERYRSEMRRAANDDMLNTVAQSITGKNTEAEWRSESVKKVPLTPMVAAPTAFTVLADAISDIVSLENGKFSNSGELNNVLETYKLKNEANLEKYKSSKVLDSLLKKRKNHHHDAILSELENIKLNSNYHSSPTKSGYIEISYEETPNTAETPSANYSFDDANSSFDAPMSPSCEKSNFSGMNFSSRNFENAETASDAPTRKKSRLKLKRGEKMNNDKNLSTMSKIQNTGRTRNLRVKPLRKYTWNSVEIREFEDEDAVKARSSKFEDKELVNDARRDSEKQYGASSSKESHVEISYSETCNNKSLNSRKPKQRNRSRMKFVRQSKISRVRKLTPSSKVKTDAARETPSRKARFSSRNARRRNYARIASGDYDLLEFEKIRKEKKVDDELIEEEQNEIDESEDDTLSDSSAAPIEISYGTLAAPKLSDYDLDGVSSTYTETDDDMKPHTFNLIPASRRLKMLKKRATSPSGEETPTKVIALSSQSTDELSTASTATSSSLDINALKKVLAVHESSGNVTSSSMSDASDIADTRDSLDAQDRFPSSCSSMEIEESNPPPLIPTRSVPEKKSTKPKMKLSEASTMENLHSLLSKVKEGDLKRFPHEASNNKKILTKRKKDRKTTLEPASPISSNSNGTFIEVGSDNGSLKNDNCDIPAKSKDIDHQAPLESNDETNEKLKPAEEEQKPENVSTNEEEIVSVTLDDLPPAESDVSEQLIDIESADIVIGENVGQSDESISTNDKTVVPESKYDIDEKLLSMFHEVIDSLYASSPLVQTEKIIEEKKDVVIENSKKDKSLIQIDSKPLEKTAENSKVKISVPVDSQPLYKKLLPSSAGFRHISEIEEKKDVVIENSKSNENSLLTQVDSNPLKKPGENTKVKISVPFDSQALYKKLLPSSAGFRHIAEIEEKKDVVIENSKSNEKSLLTQINSNPLKKPGENTKVKISVPLDSQPLYKKLLPLSAGFRCIAEIEEKKDVVTENSKSNENSLLTQVDSNPLKKPGENTKVKISVPVDSQPLIKKLLPSSADFRYIADADDPSLKKSASKPSSSHLLPTSVPSGTATIINSYKKLGNQSINTSAPIIISNSKIVNNGPKLLQNKISEPSLTNNSTLPKGRPFVLLKTSSITGSKSLLKPFKIFPKTVIPNQITVDANSTALKPKTFAVYPTLSTVKLSSVGSNSVKHAVVSTSGGVTKISDHRLKESVVSKPAKEINSKRLVLSQALKSSLKSIEITKNSSVSSSLVNTTGNPDSLNNSSRMIEIALKKSSEGNAISKDDSGTRSTCISSTTVPNNANILFTGSKISREDKSENASSTRKLNEMPTFFSKNIIRKQS